MLAKGFSLLELLTTLSIISLLLIIGIPNLSEQFKNTHTKTVAYELLSAIESARALAVTNNNRTVLLANEQDWIKGWSLFIDKNNDGVLNSDEILQLKVAAITKIKIEANTHVKTYVSFIGTGEGRKLSTNNSGAFQVGTIKVCPNSQGRGYALILSRGGRTRIKVLSQEECDGVNT